MADFEQRWRDGLVPLFEAMEYAQRVAARIPNDTHAGRKARAEKYVATMSEWHRARIRWRVLA